MQGGVLWKDWTDEQFGCKMLRLRILPIFDHKFNEQLFQRKFPNAHSEGWKMFHTVSGCYGGVFHWTSILNKDFIKEHWKIRRWTVDTSCERFLFLKEVLHNKGRLWTWWASWRRIVLTSEAKPRKAQISEKRDNNGCLPTIPWTAFKSRHVTCQRKPTLFFKPDGIR